MKKVWEIMVPTSNNNGKPFRTRYHRIWDKKVRDITGGLTIFKPVIGNWVSPDKILYVERMIPVRIIATNEEIDEIIKFTMKYYEQEAILAYVISIEVKLVHKNDLKG